MFGVCVFKCACVSATACVRARVCVHLDEEGEEEEREREVKRAKRSNGSVHRCSGERVRKRERESESESECWFAPRVSEEMLVGEVPNKPETPTA